jgi:hypothetical protein
MKKFIILVLLILVGCKSLVVVDTPTSTFVAPTTVPTATETNTPQATVTFAATFPTETATETMVPTPTQFLPPTKSVECTDIPCGPNLFFNGGFEGDYTAKNPDRYNILTADFWNFEYLTGDSPRHPRVTLDVPEAGDIRGSDFNYRVDGYQPGVNEKAQRWFKAWGTTDSGITQAVQLLRGHKYIAGAHVSTWASDNWDKHQQFSQLDTEDDRRNVEWAIRVNYSNGPVYQGVVLKTFGYQDGIYDFNSNTGRYNSDIHDTFLVTKTSYVTIGFTASNLWPYGNTDYHIDNAYLYCLDCGYSNYPTAIPGQPTPTPEVHITNTSDTLKVVVDDVNIRSGASTDSPHLTNSDGSYQQLHLNDERHVFVIYENITTGEKWAEISDPATCTANTCGWIALIHPFCANNICAILEHK